MFTFTPFYFDSDTGVFDLFALHERESIEHASIVQRFRHLKLIGSSLRYSIKKKEVEKNNTQK